MSMIFEMTDAEKKLGYSFKDKNLLRQAFTHSSYSNENHAKNNEALEFLGDSVLNFVITSYIFIKYPGLNEGQLTKMRSNIVSATPLSDAVKKLKIDQNMLLGAGEKNSQSLSINIFCDLFEAIVGAIYIDGGLECAKKFILKNLQQQLNLNVNLDFTDYKSKLSEYAQKSLKTKVVYKTATISGPSHNPNFDIDVLVDNNIVGHGFGNTKKSAEQNAAKDALNNLVK
ncbi:MAG: ribonuclease III [Firmicutes bacterium]|nr:ribonuclease III [Bacillota bacterium]